MTRRLPRTTSPIRARLWPRYWPDCLVPRISPGLRGRPGFPDFGDAACRSLGNRQADPSRSHPIIRTRGQYPHRGNAAAASATLIVAPIPAKCEAAATTISGTATTRASEVPFGNFNYASWTPCSAARRSRPIWPDWRSRSPHPKTRSVEVGCATGFLCALRQHRWASLPAEAQLYPSDQERCDKTPAPGQFPSWSWSSWKAQQTSTGSATRGCGRW